MDAVTLTFGSLFAGIGGIDLGLERAGMECRWQVEIDPYATRVLAKHWPNVRRYSDVRTVGAADLDPVDLLAGGFPCQDISDAGFRAGIGGERSGLWSDFARIICELQPRYVLVENVSALLNRGMGRVVGDLATLGYDCEWESLPAASVGAPHIRDRVWIVAYSNGDKHEGGTHADEGAASEIIFTDSSQDGRGARRSPRPPRRGPDGSGESPETMADSHSLRRPRRSRVFGESRRGEPEDGGWWTVEPDVGRVAHGIPARVDRLAGLGNAVVPQVVEYIGCRIVASEVAP